MLCIAVHNIYMLKCMIMLKLLRVRERFSMLDHPTGAGE